MLIMLIMFTVVKTLNSDMGWNRAFISAKIHIFAKPKTYLPNVCKKSSTELLQR